MLSILIAFTLDLVFKDPPNSLHPTAWMGRMIHALWRGKSPENHALAFIKGIFIPITTAVVFGGAAFLVTFLCRNVHLSGIVTSSINGFILYLTISFSRLLYIGEKILSEIESRDISSARQSLSFHLVSRDTSKLTRSEICGAVMESLSENLTDGLTAPLIIFIVLGLPGAVIYRVINTCDSMLGYRDPKREWLGKFSAKADDVLNLIPARITALVINLAGTIIACPHRGLKVMMQNHRKTESPNAGWTMASLAGILNVRLEKKGQYVLNPEGIQPKPVHLLKGISICRISGFIFIILIIFILNILHLI